VEQVRDHDNGDVGDFGGENMMQDACDDMILTVFLAVSFLNNNNR
jgi:hypothetical protein